MPDEEKEVMNIDTDMEYLGDSDLVIFQQLLAFSRYNNMPEDYWENDGIGWQ